MHRCAAATRSPINNRFDIRYRLRNPDRHASREIYWPASNGWGSCVVVQDSGGWRIAQTAVRYREVSTLGAQSTTKSTSSVGSAMFKDTQQTWSWDRQHRWCAGELLAERMIEGEEGREGEAAAIEIFQGSLDRSRWPSDPTIKPLTGRSTTYQYHSHCLGRPQFSCQPPMLRAMVQR